MKDYFQACEGFHKAPRLPAYQTKLGAYVAVLFETFLIYLVGLFKTSKMGQTSVLIGKTRMKG